MSPRKNAKGKKRNGRSGRAAPPSARPTAQMVVTPIVNSSVESVHPALVPYKKISTQRLPPLPSYSAPAVTTFGTSDTDFVTTDNLSDAGRQLVQFTIDKHEEEIYYSALSDDQAVMKSLLHSDSAPATGPYKGTRLFEWIAPVRSTSAVDSGYVIMSDSRGDMLRLAKATLTIDHVGSVPVTVFVETPLAMNTCPSLVTSSAHYKKSVLKPNAKRVFVLTPQTSGTIVPVMRGTAVNDRRSLAIALCRVVISRSNATVDGQKLSDETLSTRAMNLKIEVSYTSILPLVRDGIKEFVADAKFAYSTYAYSLFRSASPPVSPDAIFGEMIPTKATTDCGVFRAEVTTTMKFVTMKAGSEVKLDDYGELDKKCIYSLLAPVAIAVDKDVPSTAKYFCYNSKTKAWCVYQDLTDASRAANALISSQAIKILSAGDHIRPSTVLVPSSGLGCSAVVLPTGALSVFESASTRAFEKYTGQFYQTKAYLDGPAAFDAVEMFDISDIFGGIAKGISTVVDTIDTVGKLAGPLGSLLGFL